MIITIINGSPKGKQSATQNMLNPLIAVCQKMRHSVNEITLSEKKIQHCTGCYSCWFKTPGQCVLNDDVAPLLDKLLESDIIVYGTPLYADMMTGLLKNFIDRTIPLANPNFSRDSNGEAVHSSRYTEGKKVKVMIVSNCGFPERSHFDALSHWFKRYSRNMKAEVIGEIYRTQGPLLSSDSPMLESIQKAYFTQLELAYQEILDTGSLSLKVREELEQPLIPIEMYYKNSNTKFNEILA